MTHDEPEPTSPDVMREHRLQRNLKIVVATLGALILIGLGAVIIKVTGLATGTSGNRTIPSISAAWRAAGTVTLEIPKGSKVVSISLSGNRLALQHEGPDGTGITILDLGTGRRVVEVKPVEAIPKN
ncbi:hypothetical protein [Hyphomicrobium sp.]|jgi:hypothetical protein|uniref:hypothetical protein n=1 Tax=Hyphomicrobium sp. TaxID=82 RepID=UPI002B8658FA|nr:hypothetical protein [Hyphomicrobium sp.]HVZ04121.1 hypothetical protein [Hyphomicrobium sp.]